MPTVSMLASVADLAASQAAGAISQLMPSGVILPFGGATAPTGWLLCNGATISRTTYAALFSALGTAHGSGDGSTTFHLPDLRGRFVRGTDGGIARDPDRAGRTAANSGGATGDNVGSVQTNATAKNGLTASSTNPTFTGGAVTGGSAASGGVDHSHTNGVYRVTADFSNGATGLIINAGASTPSSFGTSQASSGASAFNHTHSVSATSAGSNATPTITVGAGDNETRPLNANVNYIIKV